MPALDTFFVVLVGVGGFAAVFLAAYLHVRRKRPVGLYVLWTAALLMISGSVATIFSVGSLLVLPALLTLVAALTGSARQLRSP